jgi:cytidine deaminase
MLGYETNDVLKHRMLADVIKRLQEKKLLSKELASADTDKVLEIINQSGALRDAQALNVIEFGRCVHAEMAAIVDAARRGSAVHNSTLYSSTFPCHECARHIVAAGIRRVVYIEPYPKSLVNELYPDSIHIDPDQDDDRHVSFRPFVGVAPRRYLDLFAIGGLDRKDKLGRIVKWDGEVAMPRLGEYSFRTEIINRIVEKREFAVFFQELQAAGFV